MTDVEARGCLPCARSKEQIDAAREFAQSGAEDCDHDVPEWDKMNPGFPIPGNVCRDRAVQFRACFAALDAYERVAALLEQWESDRERLESVATWDGCDHDRDLAQDAAATLASWDELRRALYGGGWRSEHRLSRLSAGDHEAGGAIDQDHVVG